MFLEQGSVRLAIFITSKVMLQTARSPDIRDYRVVGGVVMTRTTLFKAATANSDETD